MKLFLLRHGIAAPRDSRRYPGDRDRPLTRLGKRKLEEQARGMAALGIAFDLILTSPLARADETARIVASGMRSPPAVRSLPALSPEGDPGAVLSAVASHGRLRRILLVGHEPGLSRLAGLMVLGGELGLPLEFKKGGLCRIDFQAGARSGSGTLVYHLMPRILRACSPRPS
jgi:phosphohistidine phosphatase